MKIKISLILMVVLFISMTSMALASPSEISPFDKQSLEHFPEKEDVLKAIREGKDYSKQFIMDSSEYAQKAGLSKVEDMKQLEVGTPYRVVLANKEIVKDFSENKILMDSLERADYQWEVPIFIHGQGTKKSVASLTVDYFQGQWQEVETGSFLMTGLHSFSSNAKEISNVFQRNGVDNIAYFAHLRISSLQLDFLYGATEEYEEYFVPLFQAMEHYGLKNKQLYTREQIMDAIGDELKETTGTSLEGLVEAGGFGSSGEQNILSIPILFIIIGVLLVVLLVYKRNRDKNFT